MRMCRKCGKQLNNADDKEFCNVRCRGSFYNSRRRTKVTKPYGVTDVSYSKDLCYSPEETKDIIQSIVPSDWRTF